VHSYRRRRSVPSSVRRVGGAYNIVSLSNNHDLPLRQPLDDDDDNNNESIKLVFAHSYSKNSHECANKNMLWQTVQFLVHAGKRMTDDSCEEMPAASSTWAVLRSGEDRSGLCVSLERQGHHVQLSVAADGWGSRRPVDRWWKDSSAPGCADC